MDIWNIELGGWARGARPHERGPKHLDHDQQHPTDDPELDDDDDQTMNDT